MVGWYKHEIPLWMDGTESLSDGAYRAYHVICQLIYLNEGPIETHERGIAGRCNQSVRAFKKHLQELLDNGKLTLENGKLGNEKSELVLENVRTNRENARTGGQNSGKGRNPNDKSLKTNDQSEAPLKDNLSLLEKTRLEKNKQSARAINLEFENEFWSLYPHKVAKPTALRAFEKARKNASLKDILSGLSRYKKSKPPDISWANPATWLNGERWTDEPDNSPANRGSQSSEDRDYENMLRL